MTWLIGLFFAVALFATSSPATTPTAAINLAANRPTSSSSIENDEHAASRANDGSADTCWRADDEPEGVPDWWQVDLGSAFELSAVEITLPYDGMNYRYKIEGATTPDQWRLLSDQTRTVSRERQPRIAIENAHAVRFVRITITGFDSGCSASISEVNVFGSSGPRR